MTDKNTKIIASGKGFDIGCRVVLWNEEEGLSFYPKGSFYKRDISLDHLREIINCFVVHHSVTYTAHSMFRGLNARGLSCNFMIDDDINDDGIATIYQCADIKEGCWSHVPLNEEGPGVEISYHPEAWENSNLYSKYYQDKFGVQPHDIVSDKVHGYAFSKVFAPTKAQHEACARLLWGFTQLFPDIDPKFPRDNNGNIIKTTISNPEHYKGLLSHYNITRRKPDPLGFDIEWVENRIQELALKKEECKLPSHWSLLKKLLAAAKLIKINKKD